MLVITALNGVVNECCPYCCAPCYVLRELREAGTLDNHVRAADMTLNWDWWDKQRGCVRPDWFDLWTTCGLHEEDPQ